MRPFVDVTTASISSKPLGERGLRHRRQPPVRLPPAIPTARTRRCAEIALGRPPDVQKPPYVKRDHSASRFWPGETRGRQQGSVIIGFDTSPILHIGALPRAETAPCRTPRAETALGRTPRVQKPPCVERPMRFGWSGKRGFCRLGIADAAVRLAAADRLVIRIT